MAKGTIVFIGDKSKIQDDEEVGGKGSSLLKLSASGFNVTRGIILTTRAFDTFIEENNLWNELARAVPKRNASISDSEKAQEIVKSALLPETLCSEIETSLKQAGLNHKRLIVRSSANIEDSKLHSFAGQFNTVIDVNPKDVAGAIVDVYSSLYNQRALHYMEQRGIPLNNVKMAVVLQEFVQTDFAGVAFTIDPITGNKNTLLVEYVSGLGEGLVSGAIEPTSVSLDKRTALGLSTHMPQNRSQPLEENKITQVAEMAKQIEKAFGSGIDVEWGVKGSKLYVFQARPITAFGEKAKKREEFSTNGLIPVSGTPASSGLYKGTVKIVGKKSELTTLNKGEVMVASITYENYLPEMLKAGAIITQMGGITSHAAIVAREHRIPCVVGVADAMNIFRNGDSVVVDATRGIIYQKRMVRQEKAPEESMDMILERLRPYRVTFGTAGKILLSSSSSQHLYRKPAEHILVEEIAGAIIIHNPPIVKISKKNLEQLERKFGRRVLVAGPEKFETFIEVGFVIDANPKFKKIFDELKASVGSSATIDAISKRCIAADIESLDKAEKLLKRGNLTTIEAGLALEHINNSAVYFEFINTILTTGYGIKYIREHFASIRDSIGLEFAEFIIVVDENRERLKAIREKLKDDKRKLGRLDIIVGLYRTLAKWKFESDDMDEWDRRSRMWKVAAAAFKSASGHDVNEFLKGKYGSGAILYDFLRNTSGIDG